MIPTATSLSHRQKHPPKVYISLYVYTTRFKFLTLYIATRQPFPLGLNSVNHAISIFLRTTEVVPAVVPELKIKHVVYTYS